MENQSCGRDPELRATTLRVAYPFDNVIDVEDQIGMPVAAIRIADVETDAVERIVVPRDVFEVGICDCRVGVSMGERHFAPLLTRRKRETPSVSSPVYRSNDEEDWCALFRCERVAHSPIASRSSRDDAGVLGSSLCGEPCVVAGRPRARVHCRLVGHCGMAAR